MSTDNFPPADFYRIIWFLGDITLSGSPMTFRTREEARQKAEVCKSDLNKYPLFGSLKYKIARNDVEFVELG